MSRLVQYDLGDNEKLLIEVDSSSAIPRRPGDPNTAGRVTRKGVGQVVEEAGQRFEEAIDTIRPTAELIVNRLKGLSPGEISVEFGIKLGAEAGAVITKAITEANFKIDLKWTNPDPKPKPGS